MNKILKYASTLFVASALASIFYYEYNFLRGNFRAVTPGEAYRSAQLDKQQLQYYADKYKILSILNLRGKEPGAQWYKDELDFSNTRHIAHYDISLSALSEPTDKDVEDIEAAFRAAPRPILIHCLGGADRSGLAAAIWKRVIDKAPKAQAGRQLALRYGHLPFGKAAVMDRRFNKLD